MSLRSAVASNKDRFRAALVQFVAPAAAALHRARPRRRVIALHEIPPSHAPAFEAKLRWLSSWCNVVSLSALHDHRKLDPDRLNVAITFDDGYKDCAVVAAPLLAALGLPATVFVCSGAVGLEGDDAQRFARDGLQRRAQVAFMDAADLRSLADGGLFEIGGHATGHANLGLHRDPPEWRAQVVDDRDALAQMAGAPPRFFAFPFGQFTNVSPAAVEWVIKAGYDAAFTIVPSYWTGARSPWLVGRDSLDVTWPDGLWRAWLYGGYDALSAMRSWPARRRLGGSAPGSRV